MEEKLSKFLKTSRHLHHYDDYFKKEGLDFVYWFLFVVVNLLLFFFALSADAVELKIVKIIESSNNPRAYNKATEARGLYQITPACLSDYNSYHFTHYTQEDLFNPETNHRIATWYLNVRIPQLLNHYGIPNNTENRLIAYNWGIGNLVRWWKKLPQETREYLKKYQKIKKEELWKK